MEQEVEFPVPLSSKVIIYELCVILLYGSLPQRSVQTTTSSLHRSLRQRATHTDGRGYSDDIREPMWCNGNALARNARDVGLSPAIGTVFPILITPTTYVQ